MSLGSAVRVLMLTNSYPTVHSPSGAAYLTARLQALDAVGAAQDVQVDAVALQPTYAGAAASLRRLAGALPPSALALPDTEDGRRYAAVECGWTSQDVATARFGRRPEGIVRRAGEAVSAHVAGRTYDIVHAHGMYGLPAGEVARRVAERSGVPYVVSMHGSDVETIMVADPAAAAHTLRRAAQTIYVSAALRDRVAGLGLPTGHAHVIPNGVDLSTFHPGGVRPKRLTMHALRLLFVGNLLPVKGADRLPDIVERVRERHPEAHLTVAGDGPLRAGLQSRLPEATFRGRVDQAAVAGLMREADVLLVPSRSEGWGCVITESYACGTPVVATDVGGIAEAVLEPRALVAEGPDFAARFADAVHEVCATVPPAAAMREHVAGQGWPQVVARELAVLRLALR